MQKVLSTVLITAVGLFSSAASAGGTQENIALCIAELDNRGIAPAAEYTSKFKGSRGGGVKKVTILLTPKSGSSERFEAVCSIKRGEVLDIAVKN